MATETLRIGVRELRQGLSDYLRRASEGASIIVTSRDKVIAELRAPPLAERPNRMPGAMKGRIWMADDFDELPADILASMTGEL